MNPNRCWNLPAVFALPSHCPWARLSCSSEGVQWFCGRLYFPLIVAKRKFKWLFVLNRQNKSPFHTTELKNIYFLETDRIKLLKSRKQIWNVSIKFTFCSVFFWIRKGGVHEKKGKNLVMCVNMFLVFVGIPAQLVNMDCSARLTIMSPSHWCRQWWANSWLVPPPNKTLEQARCMRSSTVRWDCWSYEIIF